MADLVSAKKGEKYEKKSNRRELEDEQTPK